MDEIHKDYHRPPSYNHLSPALEKLRNEQIRIQNQYETALKDSRARGRDLSVDKIINARNFNRLSNNSVKSVAKRNLSNLVSETNSDIY